MSASLRRILLVDDDLTILKVIGKQFRMAGFEVLTALDGEEALAKARAEKPDLIVLDIMMPKRNGYEVCAELKQDPVFKQIPIIMFTAKGQTAEHLAGLLFGADVYISKTSGSKELIAQTRALLQKFEEQDQPTTNP